MPYIQIIEQDAAEGKLAELYREIQEKRGQVANIYKLNSLCPDLLQAHREMYEAAMTTSPGLSTLEREAIAVAVSVANGCHYAIWHHAEALRSAGGSEPLVVSLLLGEQPDDESNRIEKLVYYAKKLTLLPNSADEKSIIELRDAGFTDLEIYQCVQITAYFNYVNRLADGLGVEVER
jgi:uncharacterized peroxidase-related enzyme